jgi:hypothetical protein
VSLSLALWRSTLAGFSREFKPKNNASSREYSSIQNELVSYSSTTRASVIRDKDPVCSRRRRQGDHPKTGTRELGNSRTTAMSAMLRTRLSSFLAGVGVTSLACMASLKQDVEHSYGLVLDAMKSENKKLSDRVAALEASASASAAPAAGTSTGAPPS